MSRFLIWLSGADIEVLNRCPGERPRHEGIGGAVLTTSVMAALSCAFALRMAMHIPVAVSAVLGALWGLAIMNLDRWLVGSVSRRDRQYQNILVALPRVGLAVLVGLVISTPLVLALFEHEINAQMDLTHQQKQSAFERALASDERFAQLPALTEQVRRLREQADNGGDQAVDKDAAVVQLQQQYDELSRQYQQAAQAVVCELDGTCGTHQVGHGPNYDAKVARRDQLLAQVNAKKAELDEARRTALVKQEAAQGSARGQLDTATATLDRLSSEKRAEESGYAASIANDHGLLARLDALTELSRRNPTLGTAHILLLLFITSIEVLPVLVKLMANLGPETLYEKIHAAAADTTLALAELSYQHDEKMAAHEITIRGIVEGDAIASFVRRVVQVESEVADKLLAQWREGQLSKVESDPGQFIVSQAADGQPAAA